MKRPLSSRQTKSKNIQLFSSPCGVAGGIFALLSGGVVKLQWRHIQKPFLVTARIVEVKVFNRYLYLAQEAATPVSHTVTITSVK